MMAGHVELRVKQKPRKPPAQRAVSTTHRELPPSYDEALMIPERAEPAPPPVAHDRSTLPDTAPDEQLQSPSAAAAAEQASTPTPPVGSEDSRAETELAAAAAAIGVPPSELSIRSLRSELLRADTAGFRRHNSIKEEVEELVESDGSDGEGHVERADDDDDDDDEQTYSDDDLEFEAYEDEDAPRESDAAPPMEEADAVAQTRAAGPVESLEAARERSSCSAAPSKRSCFATAEPSSCVYDEHTYAIVSRLRAANKSLSTQLEKQTRLVGHLQEERKQHQQLILTLRADLQMHKQALKSLQSPSRRPHSSDDVLSSCASGCVSPRLPRVAKESSFSRDVALSTAPTSPRPGFASRGDTSGSTRCGVDRTPASPRILAHPTSPPSPATYKRSRAASPRSRETRSSNARDGAAASTNNSANALQQLLEKHAARLEKVEQERKEAQLRHGHQLANYSHELSRLERQLEHAHKLGQEKENELRLLKTRQLYAHGGGAAEHHGAAQPRGLLADDFWRSLTPPGAATGGGGAAQVSSSASLSTHIGLAFEQLLSHHAGSPHDHALDASTREWLRELRLCGAQLLQLHRSFQGMSGTFQRLAESSHLYQLAETLAREARELLRAEQALVFVVDTAEQEFWCRVPRAADAKDMVTVRSKLMPFATSAPHRGESHAAAPSPSSASPSSLAAHHLGAGRLPCGLASLVLHTKKPLLLPAGGTTRHPCYSTASDNTDRLLSHPGASTLLLPLVHRGQALGVVQLCGKLAVVAALGLSVSLEKSDAFTAEDQALLQLLAHFASGLFPKVAYFTEVESNKVNEETLIQLAPEIFTCLRFEELGKIVIQNAKEILDADRCSLFVADNAERSLHNWQSDISGGAVQVYDSSKRSGMTIPFGHGIVGLVAETRQVVNIPDAYADPRFNASWDKKTSYRTKSMLAVPILANTTKRQPIRRTSHHHDKFGAQQQPSSPPSPSSGDASASAASTSATTDAVLLGVVQVINKSGGAPFRAKDEFLLKTISKLIALAIENSQLFQQNQELCANVGRLIARADLAEALISLGASAEDIIGVESAAVYVYDPVAREMVTFHRKRRHRIVLKEPMYHNSLFGDAVRAREVLLINDVAAAASFNAYVDSIGGITVRNAAFAPLVVEDSEVLVVGGGAAGGGGPGTRLVGLVHLVNTKGRKVSFEPHDLFLSIVTSLCCSVVASILDKHVALKQAAQTARLLDTSMCFFREMSPIGVINAVFNACMSIFAVEKAHLFLWEPDRRHMWTSKLLPYAETAGSRSSSSSSATALGADDYHSPPLAAQHRRISVLTDQKLTVPTTEGLLEHVLARGAVVLVRHWLDAADADKDAAPAPPHTLRASASDDKIGFVKHAVVACPVWDSAGLEVAGVLVLLFPRDRAPQLAELTNLPILCRQIAGALNVCSDLGAVTGRSRRLQAMLEMSMKPPARAVSLTLSARGQLATFSQPVNLLTPGFSVGLLAASVHATAALNLTVRSLPMDDDGNRWGFQLSAATVHDMSAEHFAKWLGKNLAAPQAFDKLRADLQSVYVRKETATGEVDRSALGAAADARPSALPKAATFALRQLLWDFVDSAWRVDIRRACEMFDAVDPTRQRRVSRRHLEQVLATGGRGVRLDPTDWDLLHSLFADPTTDLVPVERMFEALAPALRVVPRFSYELVPILDAVTQTVVSVHLLLTAL